MRLWPVSHQRHMIETRAIDVKIQIMAVGMERILVMLIGAEAIGRVEVERGKSSRTLAFLYLRQVGFSHSWALGSQDMQS